MFDSDLGMVRGVRSVAGRVQRNQLDASRVDIEEQERGKRCRMFEEVDASSSGDVTSGAAEVEDSSVDECYCGLEDDAERIAVHLMKMIHLMEAANCLTMGWKTLRCQLRILGRWKLRTVDRCYRNIDSRRKLTCNQDGEM